MASSFAASQRAAIQPDSPGQKRVLKRKVLRFQRRRAPLIESEFAQIEFIAEYLLVSIHLSSCLVKARAAR